VKDHLDMEVIGKTIDDAAGEAFDKTAKLMGLSYPGGPIIDQLAKEGAQSRFKFSKPKIAGLDYSFSGLKTSVLYFLRDMMKKDPLFIDHNKNDLCASIQKTIIDVLLDKLIKAAEQTGISHIALAGGVSSNSGLRERIEDESKRRNWKTYLPELKYTTDNAAMIAIAGFYKYQQRIFAPLSIAPLVRMPF
jgi:N6-L-threonylcarbamoyladenine synthase